MTRIKVNERVRHGKPVIEGTRITVDEVLGMLESGMNYNEIEKEYNLKKDQIIAVIKYAAALMKGEEVHSLA